MIEVKLKELLSSRGMSPDRLVDAANITRPTVNSLLAGTSKRIEFETLEKLCRALKCEPGDIIKLE